MSSYRERSCSCGCGKTFTTDRYIPPEKPAYYSDAHKRAARTERERRERDIDKLREALEAVRHERLEQLEMVGARLDYEADQRRQAGEDDERDSHSLASHRLTGKPRECRCNGNGIFDYDQEGDAYCTKCGGRVGEVARDPSKAHGAYWIAPVPRIPTPPTTATFFVGRRKRRPRSWGDVKVYSGEPFRPGGKVTVRPRSYFEESE